jgi:hypothetical protein
MIAKLNNIWIGLLAGLIFPGIVYVIYWLLFYHQITFPVRFTRFLTAGYMLSNVIKICGLGNLLLFYLCMLRHMDKFGKGIILSLLFYIGLIAYVTYYLEPNIS